MTTEPYPRVMLVAAFLVALAAGVYAAVHIYDPIIRPVLNVLPPFVIAAVFAFLLDPVVGWFQKLGRSREFGVAIVGLLFLVVFLLVGFLVVPKVAEQSAAFAQNFQGYAQQAQQEVNHLLSQHRSLLERLHLPTNVGDLGKRFSIQIRDSATRGLSFIAGTLASGLSKILWVVIIPLATLWMLRDLDLVRAKIVHFTPDRHRDRLVDVSAAIADVFAKYIRGMLAVAIIFSAVSCVWLSAAGLDYALIIGGVSGIMYMVPYVGMLAVILATGIAAAVQPGHGPLYPAVLMGVFIIQSFIIFDCVITPKVAGGSVGVHPVLALFSLALGAQLFGVAGMILAVPCAAAFQVALGHWYPRIYDQLGPGKVEESPHASDST